MASLAAAISKTILDIYFVLLDRLPRYLLLTLCVYHLCSSIGVQAHQTIEIRIVDTDETREEQLFGFEPSVNIKSTWHKQRRSPKAVTTDYAALSKVSKEECAHQVAAAKAKNSGQMAIVVALGHDAVLPCHHCPEEREAAMNWYQLVRMVGVESGGTAWQPQEVEVDKYDDERLNRIFVNQKHQLVIRDLQPDDIGTFFCMKYKEGDGTQMKTMPFKSPDAVGTGAAGAAAAWSKVQGKDRVDMVVHVDIELPKKEILVTKSGIGYPKPAARHVDGQRNLQTVTQWEEWSACSRCNKPGQRRRRGSCFVRLLNPKHHGKPSHLDHAIRFYPSGAPCQSSIFSARDLAHIVTRSPEVEIERCEVPCEKKKGKSAFFKTVAIHSFTGVKKAHKVKKKTFTRLEGDGLQLFCTGSKDDSPVEWSFNSEQLDTLSLPTTSKGRLKVGADNVLTLTRLIPADAGTYSCSSGDLTYNKYYILVTPRPMPEEDRGLYMQYLGMVFAGDGVVFLFLLVVRHKQRLVQVTKNFSAKPAGRKRKVNSSTSSSLSSSNSSDSSE